jgi:hypothetical protein
MRRTLSQEFYETDSQRKARKRVMNQLIAVYGKPPAIRMDNGTEMTSQGFTDWAERHPYPGCLNGVSLVSNWPLNRDVYEPTAYASYTCQTCILNVAQQNLATI